MRTMLAGVLGTSLMVALVLGSAAAMMNADAGGDADRDGLTAWQELVYGTDPLSSDTDLGGADDGWEAYYQDPENHAYKGDTNQDGTIGAGDEQFVASGYVFDPNWAVDEGKAKVTSTAYMVRDNGASVGVDDPDGDGWVNYHEYVVGTDPTNPDHDGDGMLDGSDVDPLVNNDPGSGSGGNGGGGSGMEQGEQGIAPAAATASAGEGFGSHQAKGWDA